ncbi:MAG: glycosyltransferase [Burkholderiales bacterium]|nr:glycosyltransferase [Burkholderiales bacterium]
MSPGSRQGHAAASLALPLLVYALAALPLFFWARSHAYPLGHATWVALGLFGAWRYGWQGLHYLRAFIYARIHFPALRRRADQAAREGRWPAHLNVIVASYLEEAWVSMEAFQALMGNLAELPCTATVVVAVGGDEDEAVIGAIYRAHPARHKAELVFQRQSRGKRIAMGHALRAVARRHRDEEGSVTVFMDGDSWLEPGALRRSLPFFAAFADLGALTTNEVAWINGSSVWYKDWFDLKFGQRHVLFQSHSLSHKVLTLTGRFSLLRTSIVVQEEFIAGIENDTIDHWMHGRFRFLMGDDKSSWFHVLRKGWKMLYLPDVTCCSLESRDLGFLKASVTLPYRWFGNTLRNNPRALALGPARTGWFIWFAILDQRLSMWTSLVGIAGAAVLAATKTVFFLPLYLAWAVLVRVGQLVVIAFHGHPVSLRSIPIMLYSQWVGAVIKIHAWFHLADQSWSKGKASQGTDAAPRNALSRLMSSGLMVVCYAVFGFTVLVAHGALRLPDAGMFSTAQAARVLDARMYGVTPDDGQDDALALQTLIDRAGTGTVRITLPAGQLDFTRPVVIRGSGIVLAGAGQQATRIVSHLSGSGTAVISVLGSAGQELGALAQPLAAQGTVLQVARAATLAPGDLILLKQPNDDAFFDALGSQKWRRSYPFLRQALVKVKSADGAGAVTIEQAAGIAFAANSTRAFRVNAASGVVLRDFTIEQRVAGRSIAEARHRYENLLPDTAVDGIALDWTSGTVIERVGVLAAGRHPVSFENSYGFTLRQCTLDGAWNKGGEGNGYLRIARSYRGLVTGCNVRNIRHIALQWSSAFNRLEDIDTGVDVNFHGGYAHDNTATDIASAIPAQHPWPPVFRTPQDAGWAPPDGPGNTFTARASTAPLAAAASLPR